MYQKSLIVRTKLAPPRPHKHTLHRPRLTSSLLGAESHRLTIVQAGTGYGKSTALSTFAQTAESVIWYHLAAEDADPIVFLSHLIHALSSAWPGLSEAPLALLEEWERNRSASLWTNVVDSLVNALADFVDGPSFVILDDAHLLNK